MRKQLPGTPCLSARRKYTPLCIFLLMICSAAYSQPTMLSMIPDGSKNFISVNGQLYYSANDSLMTATSTSAPTLVFKTAEPIIKIYNITAGTNFFFVTQTGSGQRLWRTNGTAANTAQLIAETQITPLLVYNSQLFLQVKSSTMGIELWKMDASYNVAPLKDINPGPGNGFLRDLIIHNDLLYFFATAGNGTDLWRSDGTTAGTVLSVDLDDTGVDNPSGFYGLTSFNGEMYFTWNYETVDMEIYVLRAELWKTNGSSVGTSMVIRYPDGHRNNYLSNFLVFNGKLYFFHSTGDPAYTYLSVTDGTAPGTQHLELVTVDGRPRKLIDAGSYFLFYAEGQGYTTPLEKSDGSITTTVHNWSTYHSTGDEFIDLTYTEGRAFFLDEAFGYYGNTPQVWQADLATGVTRTLKEMYNISLDGASNIVADGGSIFFTTSLSGQMHLWYYDPSAPPYSCEGTGNIYQEIWVNAAGTDVRAFNFSTQPTGGARQFSSFETSQYHANNYASRMRGWVCAPQSGNYTFWISSDDQSELYLSTDASEENKQLIAWVYGHTQFRNYDKYPSQKSVQIYLQSGRQYYIEARHKEGNGNDFISVGWQLPDGALQRPIPGNNLIALTPGPNESPSITVISPKPDQNFSSPTWVMIAANVTDPDGVKNVQFDVLYGTTAITLATFTEPPYQYQWDEVPSGSYQLIISATDNRNSGTSEIVFFSVDKSTCAGTGTIVREIWTGVPGTSISSIPFEAPPNRTVTLTSLATPNYYGNDYGSRIRGYVCVPATGEYTFWISGDDNSELWLSANGDPTNKHRIAYVTGATRVNEWTRYSTQQSLVYYLVQGELCYIEVLHKEANGADHVEVGWQLPSGAFERPIPGNHLIPFDDPSTSAARFAADAVFSSEEEGTFAVYPNPATSGQQVSIKLPGTTDSDVQVDIKSITGISVQHETLSSSGEAVTIDLKPSIAAGMYLIRVSNNKKRWATKLQVK